MSENELVREIHSLLSGGNRSEGISVCFELAADTPDIAANIFTAYRPKIIGALHGWAREVNEHRGVFLPHRLFECDDPHAYEVMQDFEEKYGDIIDVQAQAKPIVREHVDTANRMEAQRQAITQALDRWNTDRKIRRNCATDNPERLTQIEATAIKIAVEHVKEVMKMKGIKINEIDREDLRDLAIEVVKKNEKLLSEAARRERALEQSTTELLREMRKFIK